MMEYMLALIGLNGTLGLLASNLVTDGIFFIGRDGDGCKSWNLCGDEPFFGGRAFFGTSG
jgi:hypothetical protein